MERIFERVRRGRRRTRKKKLVELRGSSFPVCQRAYNMFRRVLPKYHPKDEEAFAAESAADQGTALHRVLQKWFGIEAPDHAYGNWKCRACRKIRRHRMGLQICRRCGREMTYEEYVIKPSKKIPFSGHVDLIMKMPRLAMVVDFKGSSQQKIYDIRQEGRPNERHYLQVNAYANAINLRSGTDAFGGVIIDKVVIIYIDRGRPNRLWHPIQVPLSEKLYRKTVGLIRSAKRSLGEERVPEGLCIHPNDTYGVFCPWKDLCFDPLLDTKLESKPRPLPKSLH